MASRYWVGNLGGFNDTAHWSTSSGGAGGASVPGDSDDVFLDANSFTLANQYISIGMFETFSCGSINCVGVLNLPSIFGNMIFSILRIYGSVNFTGLLHVYVTNVKCSGGSSHTFTSGGINVDYDLTFESGTYTLQDNLSVDGYTVADEEYGGSIIHTGGTLNTNGKTVTCWSFISSGNTLTLGSSTIKTHGATITVTTLNANTSTFQTSNTGTFSGGGKTYNNLIINGTTTVSGSNTFAALTVNASKTLILTAGTTQTVTTLTATGESDQIITIQSSSSGTAATISQATGTVNAKWCTIKDSTVTGGATFNAYFSTNVSGNTGWVFYINFASLVSGYIPHYYADKNPNGTSGGQIDELNYISSGFRETFNGNGTATTFYMSFGSLTTASNVVIVNNATLTSGAATSGFNVSYASGYFTLTTAASTGVGNVDITAYKPVLAASCITNCTFAATYGEGNNTNVYLSGNRSFPARVWWSDTLDPTYFPATSYADIGETNDKMMGFLPHGNTFLFCKYRSIHGQNGAPPNQSIVEIYKGEGLIATDSLRLADGYPTFMSQRGVVQLQQQDLGYKLELISKDINGIPGIRNGIITETLANRELAFAWVFDNKYFLWLNGTIWVYEYNLKSLENNEMVYPWIPWKTFTNAACFVDKDNYLYFAGTGNLFKFDPTTSTDDGAAIDAFWLGKKYYPSDRRTINHFSHLYWYTQMTSNIATSTVNFTAYVSGASSVKSVTFTPDVSYKDYSTRHSLSYRSDAIQYMIRENSTGGGFSLKGVDTLHSPVRRTI